MSGARERALDILWNQLADILSNDPDDPKMRPYIELTLEGVVDALLDDGCIRLADHTEGET